MLYDEVFEHFQTYCVNSQVADSACSATAYLTGVKGNIKTIGVTADVAFEDWQAMANSSFYTTSIAQWAQDAGKGTGFVTTCSVVDASPVGLYGHTASRSVGYRLFRSVSVPVILVPHRIGSYQKGL